MPGSFNDYLDKIKNRRTEIEYSNFDEENFEDDLDDEV